MQNKQYNISEQCEQKILQNFQKIDQNFSNDISLEELKTACNNMNIQFLQEDYELFSLFDKNKDKGLELKEFRSFILYKLENMFLQFSQTNNINNNQQNFNNIQEEYQQQQIQDKFITKLNFLNVLQNQNLKINERYIDQLFKNIDKNQDDIIDFNEFCEFYADLPSPSQISLCHKLCSGSYSAEGMSDLVMVNMPPPQNGLHMFALAGGMGGVIARCLTAPMEKIKVLLQTQSIQNNSNNQKNNNLIQTSQQILKNEGFKGFYQGNLINCIRIFPTSAIACLVYSRMIKYTPVDNQKNPNQPLWRFFSGFLAGTISTTLTHPLDVYRIRIMVEKQSIKEIKASIKKQKAYFKGLGPTLLTIAPFMGLQQTSYDLLVMNFKNKEKQISHYLFFGALSGLIAQTATYPLDVIRKIAQINTQKNTNSLQIFKQLKQQSIKNLFSGIGVSYLKVLPTVMSSLVTRDFILGKI